MAKRSSHVERLTVAQLKDRLADVGRLGQVFVEGDLCRKAYFPDAQNFMTGDDMNFDPAAFVPLKKTLLRLERAAAVPCATTLWRQRPDDPESGEGLIFGTLGSPLAGGKPGNRGYVRPKMFPQLAAAFVKGRSAWKVGPSRITDEMADRGLGVPARGVRGRLLVEHFVPIKDSMGEVAAVLEVFAAALGT